MPSFLSPQWPWRRTLEQALRTMRVVHVENFSLPGHRIVLERSTLAGTLLELGGVCRGLDDFAAARAYYEESLDMQQELSGGEADSALSRRALTVPMWLVGIAS